MTPREKPSDTDAPRSPLERRVAQLAALEDERERREESYLIRSALEGTQVVVFNQDRNLRYTWVYNAPPRFSATDIIGKTDDDLLPPDDAARMAALKRRVMRTGIGERAEVRATVGGEPFFYDLHVRPMRSASGEVTGVTCVSLDISERVKVEQEFLQSEARQRALLNAIPDMIFRLRADGTCTEFIPAKTFEPLLPPDKFLGKKLADLLPPSVAGLLRSCIDRAFATGAPQSFEYPLIADENERHFEARLMVSGHDEAVALVREITQRKHAEQNVLQRDRQLERLLAAAIRLNSQHELEKVLQEVADSARDVIGCRYAALGILNEERDGLTSFVVSGLSVLEVEQLGSPPTGRGLLGVVLRAQHPVRLANLAEHPEACGFPSGHPPMRTFLGVPVLGRDGPIGNLYFTDKLEGGQFSEEDESIAKMLAAEAAVAVENARLLTALHAMQESRERFYAMVSHEVRNALTAVHGWAELFKRSAGPEPPRPVVETVEAAEYALDMVNDLLDLTRLEAAKIEPVISYAEASEIAELAVMVVEPFANEEEVTIEVVGLDGTEICRTDAKRVQQILINLLRNAVRHSAEGSTVKLKVSANDMDLCFAVVDTGEGISPEQQAIIFDAYKRADSKAGGGTGLGLTLSRSLARLLGGDLDVDSMVGKGSTFSVRIPRNLPDETEPAT